MGDSNSITLFDPEDAHVGRLPGHLFDDRRDRIQVTYNVKYEGEVLPVQIISPLDEFSSLIVALLNGYGFPEGDLEYVAERLIRTVQAEDNAQAAIEKEN